MPATLRKDFDEFLFTPVGKDASGMPVTLLTVLARLGVDPWEEAADLAHLALEPAMQRLTSRLEAMPNAPATPADTVTLATRLIALLHRRPVPKVALPEAPLLRQAVSQAKGMRPAVYFLVGLIFVMIAQWFLSTRHTQPLMDTTITQDSRE
ncbi:MAG TPA: hypothetical protein VFU13_00745 [Steroidobacteraceae bacterium]|nr:hypothetical protein [Steroidobacteraceae bacterium]